jgi:hypothetical protein
MENLRKILKEKNWERDGLLMGLNGKMKMEVEKHLNLIDIEKIKDDLTLSVIAPMIRKIVSKIVFDDNDKLLESLNINDFTEKLDYFCRYYLPMLKKYFNFIDYQAELLNLFCKNYLNEIENYGVN